jgi:hypothetical protein
MFVTNEMKVGITYTSPLNTPDYYFRMKLFVGPSVTSSSSRNEQFGFFLGYEGAATFSKKLRRMGFKTKPGRATGIWLWANVNISPVYLARLFRALKLES